MKHKTILRIAAIFFAALMVLGSATAIILCLI
ncbi:unknown [Candidatus Apopatosoma intestinale]|nr:unknown [Candidatus Apopatosoma intestinale]